MEKTPFDDLPWRDARRIPLVLGLIRREWEQNPDQRFFQLVENLKGELAADGDVFFLEDDELVKCLEQKKPGEGR